MGQAGKSVLVFFIWETGTIPVEVWSSFFKAVFSNLRGLRPCYTRHNSIITIHGGVLLQTLFRYNWMVREQWYQWCEDVSEEELLKARIGGVGSILKTLFHVADV